MQQLFQFLFLPSQLLPLSSHSGSWFHEVQLQKIVLLYYDYPISDLEFHGFDVQFISGFNKAIKYATFQIEAFNPVNDLVASKKIECIGQIDPFTAVSYHFDNIFASKIIDHFEIKVVNIQFTDKSATSILGVKLEIAYLSSEMQKVAETGQLKSISDQVLHLYLNEKFGHTK